MFISYANISVPNPQRLVPVGAEGWGPQNSLWASVADALPLNCSQDRIQMEERWGWVGPSPHPPFDDPICKMGTTGCPLQREVVARMGRGRGESTGKDCYGYNSTSVLETWSI